MIRRCHENPAIAIVPEKLVVPTFLALVIAEPYRIFFPVGWLMGIVGTSYWLFVSTGIVSGYAPLYHGLVQIELFAAAFAAGFLLTALPKFFRSRPVTPSELCTIGAAYVGLAGLILGGVLEFGQWAFITFLLLLVRFAAVRMKERKAVPPYSFILVAFGLFEGILGAILLVAPLDDFPLVGRTLVEQGIFLSLSLGIGSFLGPRLMGVVDTANAVLTFPGRGGATVWFKSPWFLVSMIGMVLFGSFFIEAGVDRDAGLLLRAASVFLCLWRFGIFKAPNSSPIGVLAAVSLWSMAGGVLAAAVLPDHAVGAMHLTYIGGFGLLILSIGAQVITSHGLVPRFWLEHRRWALLIGILTGVAVILRCSSSFFSSQYFLLLGGAAAAFTLALLLWGTRVLRYIPSRASARE